jgi:glycosyltransferase involved in cell wall biosynthesis
MKISAFIITLNEAENIERCLCSLSGLVDEIVVVDACSHDRTREIAAGSGARVLVQSWQGFVAQKNFALAQCSHDWVLSIDADEEISPELRQEIQTLKPQLQERAQQEHIFGYAVPRRVYYRGRWILYGDWNPDYVTRLFYRPQSTFEGGEVHESVRVNGKVERLQELLWHYTYRDEADHLARLQKYSTLWARSKFATGKRVGVFSPYGRAAFRFVRAALLKQGWRDGALGWRIAQLSAYEVWLKYQKLRRLQQGESLE